MVSISRALEKKKAMGTIHYSGGAQGLYCLRNCYGARVKWLVGNIVGIWTNYIVKARKLIRALNGIGTSQWGVR